MEKLTVERSIWIGAPRERVWEAVTNPEQVMRWFVPNLPYGLMKRDDNGKVTIHIGEMGLDFVILEVVDPLRQLTSRTLPDRLITTTYTLDEERDGTRITVTAAGFEKLLAKAGEDRLAQSSASWEQTLQNLRAYVNGAELPFPKAFVGPLFGYWRGPKQKLAIERSIWIATPRERVWRAITDPKQLQQWFSPTTPWELSALEVGGRYYVYNTETNSEMYVQVIELIDPTHQLITRSMPEPPDTIMKTTVYTLTEEDGGTRLTVTHSGYEQSPEDTRWGEMEQNTFGFGMMLQNAKAYLEGQDLPFPGGF
jgi:uncharacterized protein YndB with AHSA1/START domain